MSITLNLVSSRNYRAVTGTGRQNVGLVWMNCNEMQINLCRFFIVCFVIRDPIIKRRRIEIPLTGWTQPLFSACSNPEPGFGWVFFFSMVWGERWLFILLILVNCRPSLFQLSFHNYNIKRRYGNLYHISDRHLLLEWLNF